MNAMSSNAAAASPSGSASPGCGAQLYNIPVQQDAACAIPYGSSDNATDIMSSCCNSAPVISYYDDCGLYCLAQDQTVGDLTDCLMQSGALPQNVFCSSNETSTATGSSNTVPTSAQASIVAGATGSSGGSGGSSGSSEGGLNGVDSEDSDSSDNGASAISGSIGLGRLAVALLGLLAMPFLVG